MKRHHLYYSKTSFQFILWIFGLSFGINVMWSTGLFVVLHIFEQMTKQEYEKAREQI